MNCQSFDGQHESRRTARPSPAMKPREQAPGLHWATTHLYFSPASFDAGMKRLCIGLIILLVVVGAQALATEQPVSYATNATKL